MNLKLKMVLALLVTGLVIWSGTYWYVHHKGITNKAALQTRITTPSTTKAPSPTVGWKTYTSKEGFTLKYPPDWVLSPGNGSRNAPPNESADIKSPDGLIVRYTGPGSGALALTTDVVSCGQQSVCDVQNVLSVDSFTVLNHGPVELVKSLPDTISSTETPAITDSSCFKMNLHEPSGSSTTPKIGKNSYKDHMIFYSLLSKYGIRFTIHISNYWVPSTTSGPVYTFKCTGLTQSEFFAKTSVQQAETILRSLSY